MGDADSGKGWFDRAARGVARCLGRPAAFLVATGSVVAWLAWGPLAGWSETWQLWANTATTVVTFLMGFLILASQNRDSEALHKKLDEVLRAEPEADDGLRGIEKS